MAQRRASLLGQGQFFFLNEAGNLSALGWDNPAKAKLWRYNQHYFDDLNALAADDRKPWHDALIADWIGHNPPAFGTAWEPYPTAVRIINWVKWGLRCGPMPPDMAHSLAVQTRWLAQRLEWHLLGNHLFLNAKALIFSGLFFTGDQAENWLRTGVRILQTQIPEQILPDGGQFELSPMYHALAIEDMLDLINIARAFGRDDLAQDWSQKVPAMLHWLETMTHPDQSLGFFNDTALGIAPAIAQLLDYAKRLGFGSQAAAQSCTHLAHSGYARLVNGPAVVIADLARVGPDYLPGHAHADTLSYEMSLFGQRVVVNSGTSVYGLGGERLRQRGTAAHSTVVIDGQNSSEVWSGFRVGRRAKPFDMGVAQHGGVISAFGAHDGYRHLMGAPVHRRTWHLESLRFVVTDHIQGVGNHRIDSLVHLAPGCVLRPFAPGRWQLYDDTGRKLAMVSTKGGRDDIIASTWHPEFGKSIDTKCLKLTVQVDLPYTLQIEFDWSNP